MTEEIETTETEETPVSDLRADIEEAVQAVDQEVSADRTEREAAQDGTNSTQEQRQQPVAPDSQTLPEGTEAPVMAPLSWSNAEKEMFSKLPRDLQHQVVERERQRDAFIQRKSQEVSATLRDYSQAIPEVEREHQRLLSKGVNLSKGEILTTLINGQRALESDPVNGLRQLAESFGVDLAQLASEPAPDPRLSQMQQQLSYYQNQLQGIQSAQQAEYTNHLSSVVDGFKTAVNDKGQPLFPYAQDPNFEYAMAEEVKVLRAQNPYAGPDQLLQAAYDALVWKTPELREAEIQKQMGIQEARRISAEKQKVQQARRLGASISGAPNGTVQVSAGNSLRDDLLRAAEEAGW